MFLLSDCGIFDGIALQSEFFAFWRSSEKAEQINQNAPAENVVISYRLWRHFKSVAWSRLCKMARDQLDCEFEEIANMMKALPWGDTDWARLGGRQRCPTRMHNLSALGNSRGCAEDRPLR
jgi:hypothetical protein